MVYLTAKNDTVKYWGASYNRDEPQKLYTEWKKPDTEDYTMYESIYMPYPKVANLWARKQMDGCQEIEMEERKSDPKAVGFFGRR